MGRIRTVLPEIVANAKFAALTDGAARLCYGLLSLVDDAGRCNASPQYLAGQIFFIRTRPMNVISKLIGELEAAGFIARYEADGAQYLEIVGFLPPPKGKKLARSVLSQRIDRPQPSQIPAPSWADSSNGSPNDSTPYHDPDPDPRPPTAISESEEGGKQDRTAAPLAGGLTPRPGGRAEKLQREYAARGGDVEAKLVEAAAFISEQGIEVKNREAWLVSWFTKAIAKLTRNSKSRSGRLRIPKMGEINRDNLEEASAWFEPTLGKLDPPDGRWAINDDNGDGLFVFYGAYFEQYLDASSPEARPWECTERKVGGRRVWECS